MNIRQSIRESAISQRERQGRSIAMRSAETASFEVRTDFVPARISSYTVITAGLKWRYSWAEVRFTESTASVAVKSNGLDQVQANYAYNWNELANTVGFWAPLGGIVNVPAGFTLQPIAANTPVLLFPIRDTTGALFWVFDKVNAIDGACP